MILIAFIVGLFIKTVTIFAGIGSAAVDTAESGMREPLQHYGVVGIVQTLILALVPLLTMIASVKLMRGIFRVVLVVGMLGALMRIMWPLMGQVSGMV